ncbi:MAG: type II toxin-antitoxin system RelE/ParE family toxin [Erysipelotrichaceae bacterium]|nr:type II toxin-antitoxin system RelE/ParE family toxin [Erysipelotrichaceae bacterium]
MKYRFYTSSGFDRQFKKLDRSVQNTVNKWIKAHLIDTDDPYAYGKALTGNLKGYWRYRIGSYRLLVKISDSELIIIAVDIDHRSVVYR